MSRRAAARSSATSERDRIADTLRLAECWAARPSRCRAAMRRIADDVIAYARANNITQIVIGKSTRSRWFEILHGSVVHDLVRRCRQHQRARHRRRRGRRRAPSRPRRCAQPSRASHSTRGPTFSRSLAVALVARRSREADRTLVRHRERRPRVPDRRSWRWRRASACGPRCWPAWSRRSATISSSCRRFTPSPSPTRPMSLAFVLLHRHGGDRLQRGRARAHAGGHRDRARAHAPSRSMPSAASSPASARSTTCCGPPPTRPP